MSEMSGFRKITGTVGVVREQLCGSWCLEESACLRLGEVSFKGVSERYVSETPICEKRSI